MKNSDKALAYLKDNQATITELTSYLGISRQAIHRMLNKLMMDGKVVKLGTAPKVFYQGVSEAQLTTIDAEYTIDEGAKSLIDDTFMFITSFGEKKLGWAAFITWCEERKQNVEKMAALYVQTRDKYEKYKVDGLVDGIAKLRSTFDTVALDEVFYLDFYSIEIFGKTKLGQLLLFAKQSQDVELMNQLIDSISPAILDLVKRYSIDGVAFVPPTVKREHQLMKQLAKRLNLSIRAVSLVKVKTPVIIPQKTLNKLEDRIVNAKETIIVDESGTYDNILIIDDAVGSGATLNEVAKKIQQKGICRGKIVGLAITGSVKGFDVISEV